MSTISHDYPKTMWTIRALSLGTAVIPLLLNCSKPLTVGLWGISLYGTSVGMRLANFPSRLMNCGRVIQIIMGASVACALFYKISGLLPADPKEPPWTFTFSALGALAASHIIPFAQDLYHFGRYEVLRNTNQFDSDSEIVFL